MSKTLARLSALLLLCLAGFGLKAQVHSTEQIEVELVAETTTVVPGETLWLGIRLDPIENWHTYWKFGGDSGEPTSLNEWIAPTG
ncbi:MAG: thioredoxin, partial [Gammaproteobacteria bacterium]|nr:thioredoxin [Gammaproteobacteria bacterium]